MKRKTGPSGRCQYASFTKNLWKNDRQREKGKYKKKEKIYSKSPKPAAVHIHGFSASNPLLYAAMEKFAHWKPQMAVRAK